MKNHKSKRTIRFINTFIPVVPLYQAVFPMLEDAGCRPLALQSRGSYRSQSGDDTWQQFQETTWAPASLMGHKRWCALFFMLLAPFRLLWRPKTINIFLTQPPLFFILGALISKLTKVRYVVHIMDMHPELLALSGILSRNRLFYQILSRLEGYALAHAEHVIVIGRCMKQRLIQKGIEPKKIQIIPNWASSNVTPQPKRDNLFRQQHQLEKKFIVLYSGNMGIPHEFSTILHVAKKLEHFRDILFLFIGQGTKRKEIETAISKGAANLQLLDFQEESMLPYSLSAADVHFLSLRAGFEGIVVPSKFYGMLASGRPILYEGNKHGEVAQAIHEIGAGSVIEPGDVEQLYHNILRYYHNHQCADGDGKKGHIAYREKYTESIGAKSYAALLLKIVSKSAGEN